MEQIMSPRRKEWAEDEQQQNAGKNKQAPHTYGNHAECSTCTFCFWFFFSVTSRMAVYEECARRAWHSYRIISAFFCPHCPRIAFTFLLFGKKEKRKSHIRASIFFFSYCCCACHCCHWCRGVFVLLCFDFPLCKSLLPLWPCINAYDSSWKRILSSRLERNEDQKWCVRMKAKKLRTFILWLALFMPAEWRRQRHPKQMIMIRYKHARTHASLLVGLLAATTVCLTRNIHDMCVWDWPGALKQSLCPFFNFCRGFISARYVWIRAHCKNSSHWC